MQKIHVQARGTDSDTPEGEIPVPRVFFLQELQYKYRLFEKACLRSFQSEL